MHFNGLSILPPANSQYKKKTPWAVSQPNPEDSTSLFVYADAET